MINNAVKRRQSLIYSTDELDCARDYNDQESISSQCVNIVLHLSVIKEITFPCYILHVARLTFLFTSSAIRHPRGKTTNSCTNKHRARNKRTTAINPAKVVGTASKNARN